MNTDINQQSFFFSKDNHIQSWVTYNRAIFTGQLSLVVILVSIFFILFNYLNHNLFLGKMICGITLTISLITFVINRNGYYGTAKIITLLLLNSVVFLGYIITDQLLSVAVFFLPPVLISFAFYGADKTYYGYIASAFSLFLFIAGSYVGPQLNAFLNFPPGSIQVDPIINFTIVILISIFIIIFLLRIASVSEERLRTHEKSLRKMTLELSESRKRYQLAFKGSGAGIWDWDILNQTLYISPLLMDLLNQPDNLFGNVDADFFIARAHPEHREKFKDILLNHLHDQQTFSMEYRMQTADDNYIWIKNSGQAEWDDMGNPVRMVGSIVDISKRKETEDKIKEQNFMLEKANKELDRFVYSTSHDLKAPLTSVLGLINIAEISDDPDEQRACLKMMTNRIKTLNEFINEIIDYSRNTRTEIKYERVNLNDLIDEIMDNLAYYEDKRSIRFDIDISKTFEIYQDKNRLKIILTNLISNAVKYHNTRKEDPYIKIYSTVTDEDIILKIEDNGTGIPISLQSNIFDMFFRASEKSEGSGLGLYISKEMADKLNGDITVSSEVGKGSVFTIIIPVIEKKTEAKKEPVA